jgi:fructose-bisphosphate aldolase class II
MPLVNSKDILAEARAKKYGIPSLLAGNLEMIVGAIRAAEAKRSPLILAFNQEVTPEIPLDMGLAAAVGAARQATVPVATILDHGHSLVQVMQAIQVGSSSVMFDGSGLPYEENVKQTSEVVRVAHAVGVCVEAELGGIAGSSIEIGEAGPEGHFLWQCPRGVPRPANPRSRTGAPDPRQGGNPAGDARRFRVGRG